MAHSESSSITVARRGSMPEDDDDSDCTIVWLRGEHDIATKVGLVVAIARAAQRDDSADVLVDLSGVTFMDASTIGAIVGSRNRLRSRSQSLDVRTPSVVARRVLDLCGLAHLVRVPVSDALHPAGEAAALSTWVDVPSTEANPEHDADTNPRVLSEGSRLGRARRSAFGAAVEADRVGP
jgi:anti-anti-sigma factor